MCKYMHYIDLISSINDIIDSKLLLNFLLNLEEHLVVLPDHLSYLEMTLHSLHVYIDLESTGINFSNYSL